MTRICVLIAQLDPEDAFEGTVEVAMGGFGTLRIVHNKLQLVRSEAKDASIQKVFDNANAVIKAYLSTLAWVTDIGVGYTPFDYVEFVDGSLGSTIIGTHRPTRNKVEKDTFLETQNLMPLVMSDSYLLWALEDYRTALRQPGHELIFLYRSIEWLKVRFGSWEEAWGTIKSTKRRIKAIKRYANDYFFARHAVTGRYPAPSQVVKDAFRDTRIILEKYMGYLRSQAVNRT